MPTWFFIEGGSPRAEVGGVLAISTQPCRGWKSDNPRLHVATLLPTQSYHGMRLRHVATVLPAGARHDTLRYGDSTTKWLICCADTARVLWTSPIPSRCERLMLGSRSPRAFNQYCTLTREAMVWCRESGGEALPALPLILMGLRQAKDISASAC